MIISNETQSIEIKGSLEKDHNISIFKFKKRYLPDIEKIIGNRKSMNYYCKIDGERALILILAPSLSEKNIYQLEFAI